MLAAIATSAMELPERIRAWISRGPQLRLQFDLQLAEPAQVTPGRRPQSLVRGQGEQLARRAVLAHQVFAVLGKA